MIFKKSYFFYKYFAQKNDTLKLGHWNPSKLTLRYLDEDSLAQRYPGNVSIEKDSNEQLQNESFDWCKISLSSQDLRFLKSRSTFFKPYDDSEQNKLKGK